MALNALWESLCTPFPAQAYLSLTTVLESILTTDDEKTEITHRLAERVAALLTRNGEERVRIYRQVKELYNIRSKLIHGKAHPKKGPITMDKLSVTAKFGIVPATATEQLAGIALKVLKSALRNKDLVTLIQSKQGKGARSKALSDFFVRLVLAN